MTRRSVALFGVVALVVALIMTRGLIAAPGYTDAYYHFNAATRLANEQGLTDAYVWTYIGATDRLPMPSHLYWMPLTSVIAGLSMALFGAAGDYAVAQLPFTLMFAGAACVGYWLGWRICGGRRQAWVAGLLMLFSGFYAKFWGEIDTFAPYALIGSLCLAVMGVGVKHTLPVLIWLVAGMLAGLGHLTRADGLLLVIVGVIALVRVGLRRGLSIKQLGLSLAALLTGYVLVMLPYFGRNLGELGTPLPLGGTQAIWFDEYDDIFNYPPDASPQTLLAGGLGAVFESRREAAINNIATFVAVEGMVVLTPLMLIGWWRRRRDALLLPFALYAIGMHLAMTLVFPFPGFRGGLLHSSAALLPFWAALGVAGLDDMVEWVAKRRRHWQVRTAKIVFSVGLVLVAVGLSVYIGWNGRVGRQDPHVYAQMRAILPSDARVFSDDPPELYYYTGMGGATLPNEAPEVLLEVAEKYGIGYVLLKDDGAVPNQMRGILGETPDFLTLIPIEGARLYAIE